MRCYAMLAMLRRAFRSVYFLRYNSYALLGFPCYSLLFQSFLILFYAYCHTLCYACDHTICYSQHCQPMSYYVLHSLIIVAQLTAVNTFWIALHRSPNSNVFCVLEYCIWCGEQVTRIVAKQLPPSTSAIHPLRQFHQFSKLLCMALYNTS